MSLKKMILLVIGILFLITSSIDYNEISIIEKEKNAEDREHNRATTQRIVLVEDFTNTGCGPCAGANPHFDRLADEYGDNKIAFVRYHVHWPSGNDPFYTANSAENDARRSYYGVNSVPWVCCDGTRVNFQSSYYTDLKSDVDARLAIPSKVQIDGSGTLGDSSGTIDVHVEALDTIAATNLVVRIMILESNISFNAPNGETNHRFIVRDMVDNANGQSISLSNSGDDVDISKNFNINPAWNTDEMTAVVFVQSDATKEVLQSKVIRFPVNAAPTVSLDHPVGDEVVSGDLQIEWTAADQDLGDTLAVTLEYRRTGGWTQIATDLDNTGSYLWDTLSVVDAAGYQIKVTVSDSGGKSAFDAMSGTFEIDNDLPPVVSLTSPVGAEVWNGSRTITWVATDDFDDDSTLTIKLESTRNDVDFSIIYSNLDNTGSYIWDTTRMVDDVTYKVRITAKDSKGQESTAVSPLAFELVNGVYEDTDEDGMPDFWEDDNGLDRTSDGDEELDPDADGLTNLEEYEKNTDPHSKDTDNDGMGDGWEVEMGLDPLDNSDSGADGDEDGLTNLEEFQIGTFPDTIDSDHDGMPDGWEVLHELLPMDYSDEDEDPDEDDLTNAEEYEGGTDPNEADTDKDGLPDGWEVEFSLDPLDGSDGEKDLDADGLTNLEELTEGTDPDDPDNDGDGLPDGWEVNYHQDPNDDIDARGDPDGDGLINLQEFQYNTSPIRKDTDGDGIDDGWEIRYGLNPLDKDDAGEDQDDDGASNLEEFENDIDPTDPDTDGDGMPDGWELEYDLNPDDKDDAGDDADNDAATNLDEYENGIDPTKKDTDKDGMPDGWELKYNFDPDSAVDGDEDSDGDGMSNLDEYIGESNPNLKDVKSSGGPDGDGSSIWIIIVVVIIILLGIVGLVMFLVVKGKKKEGKADDLGRIEPEESPSDYHSLYGTSRSTGTTGSGEMRSSASGGNPACPKCDIPSTYYPEHECHWCDHCQDYVHEGGSGAGAKYLDDDNVSIKPKTAPVGRRRVIKKVVK